MHLREFVLCIRSLSYNELYMPEVLCSSDTAEVKPASRAKAVKETIIQKPLTFFLHKNIVECLFYMVIYNEGF